jgi:tRNA-dihydrouridine synthase B
LDINFGCSANSICRQHCGAAILKDPNLAVKIVSSVRNAVSIPLFVKFRTGWKDDPMIPVGLAKRFEDAGADALTFHPRVSPDRRARLPKWEYIGFVKNAVSIPVFGNGNIFDVKDCLTMMKNNRLRRCSDRTAGSGKTMDFCRICRPFYPGYRHLSPISSQTDRAD